MERLAILRDRQERGASEPGDLAEALSLASTAHAEAAEAQRRLAEMESLRGLISASEAAIRESLDTADVVERHLATLAAAEEQKAKFYAALTTPRVLVPLGFLALLILGSLVGALTIEPVQIQLPRPLDMVSP